jgi:hypothetical protein
MIITQVRAGAEATNKLQTGLDSVISQCYGAFVMAGQSDAAKGMRLRLIHECERIAELRSEMEKLNSAYNRYQDLQNEALRRQKRTQRIAAVLGRDGLGPAFDPKVGNLSIVEAIDTTPSVSELRNELPLWEAMKEYLHHVPEARIAEMQQFFTAMGLKNANRQAIESALIQHPKTFAVKKRKREKFILLKAGARD